MNPYHALLSQLAPVKDWLDATDWPDLEQSVKQLDVNLAMAREADRNLRIAVVGQMKAGKSSFLNAAFFGFDLLPKADTPMTAALTRIAYAEKPRAEVVFYDADDWADMRAKADEYHHQYEKVKARLVEDSMVASHEIIDAQISEALRAAQDGVQRIQAQGLIVEDFLGKRQSISNLNSAREIARALHDYVGVGGKFTAITKMTELYVDDARFKDIEVFDTPGFNDPVVSRGELTKNFLGQCDVVFLLSTVSQFFAHADLQLLRSQLSAAGVSSQAVILVGTQRDVALRQDRGIATQARQMVANFPPDKQAAAAVAAMIHVLGERMKKHVQATLAQHLRHPQLDDNSRVILRAVQQADPVFISSWSWMLAENIQNLAKDDQDQLAALCRDTGFNFDADSLRELSNIPALRKRVTDQRERKDELLAEKEQNLIKAARSDMAGKVEKLVATLQKRIQKVENDAIDNLRRNKADAEKRINGGRSKLETVFESYVLKAQKNFALLKTEIKGAALNYSQIAVQKETKSEAYEVSTSHWYKPWSWGGSETRYREVVTINASAQDAIENLNRFALETRRSLQGAIMDIVNLVELRATVSQAAMSLFDTGSADFDGEYLLDQVQRSLGKITLPEIDFGQRDYSSMIVKQFGSGLVSESNIDGLRQAQSAALAAILADMESAVASKTQEISRSLNTTCNTFVGALVSDLNKQMEGLCMEIENREKSLQSLRQALSVLEAAQKTLDYHCPTQLPIH